MLERRTDLAIEAREIAEKSAKTLTRLPGVRAEERRLSGHSVTLVEILDEEGAKALKKPVGRYCTLELTGKREQFHSAVQALGTLLRELLPEGTEKLLVAGLGNAGMTPDAIGPTAVRHILVTRHLSEERSFSALTSTAAVAVEVTGNTGIEAAEQVRALTEKLAPDAVIVIDALAAREMKRLCRTVQLSDTGIVPGSGVGNHRMALAKDTLGVPVLSLGVPTVVEGATLAMDLLEEAGIAAGDEAALRQGLFVTPKEIDAEVKELARLLGYGINAALYRFSAETSAALLG